MLEISRSLRRFEIPIHALQPVIEHGVVVTNSAQVAFEMLDIHGVETDQSSIETNVYLGEFFPKDKGPPIVRDDFLKLIQGPEYRNNIFVIDLLRRCKSSLVDAGIDIRLDPRRERINLGA